MYEWNETKRKTNLTKHGVDFAAVESFVWEEALVTQDNRNCVAFSVRGENIRVISLRKANSREVERYGQKGNPAH